MAVGMNTDRDPWSLLELPAGMDGGPPLMGDPAVEFMGALLIEVFICCILYGLTILQTFIYVRSFPNDKPILKLIVGIVWLAETLHVVFSMNFLYEYLIHDFGHPERFINVYWSVNAALWCSFPVALCVQGFFTWRVWIVSNRRAVWTTIIAFFVFLRIGFGIASTVMVYVYNNWAELHNSTVALVLISGGLGSAALVDVLVAVSLICYMKRGSKSLRQQADSRVNKVILYSVNTGAITCAASLLGVILFATKKNSLGFLGLVLIETKLYANSLLCSLNMRVYIRNPDASSGWHFTSAIRATDMSLSDQCSSDPRQFMTKDSQTTREAAWA